MYVGAVIERGGVAHISQGGPIDPVLDEDSFAEQTGMRLSYPARSAIRRLLMADVLLHDVRALVLSGALVHRDGVLRLDEGADLPAESMAAIAQAVAEVNRELGH